MLNYKHNEVKKGDAIKSSEWNNMGFGVHGLFNDDITLFGNKNFNGNLSVTNGIAIYGSISGKSSLRIEGDASIISNITGGNDLFINGNIDVKGKILIQSKTQKQINLYDFLNPVGSINTYAGTDDPEGWFICNGRELNRIDYEDLFAVIGISYGNGDGINTFNIPDLRGQFLRGVDNSAGVDPDVEKREKNGSGAADAPGSKQEDEFKSHNHEVLKRYKDDMNKDSVSGGNKIFSPVYVSSRTNSGNRGGKETRPKNVYVNFIIKY